MSKINATQIDTDQNGGGNYPLLSDFLNSRQVYDIPFSETHVVTAAAVQYKLLPSSIVSGYIAKGTAAVKQDGIVAAALAGAVGTAAITSIADSRGTLLNQVAIRDATTHDPIMYVSGDDERQVYGLIQCSSTVTDGDAIAANPTENLQISFVYTASDGTITLTSITADVEFMLTGLNVLRNTPTIVKESGKDGTDVLSTNLTKHLTHIECTTAYPALSVITLSTGAGNPTGAGTVTTSGLGGVTLNASAALFYADTLVEVTRNGVKQTRGAGLDVVWDSTTTFHFTDAIDIGEEIEVTMIIQ